MTAATEPLTYAAVDQIAFACENNSLNADKIARRYSPKTLGPLLELLRLADSCLLPTQTVRRILNPDGAVSLLNALAENRTFWQSPGNRRIGYVRCGKLDSSAASERTEFFMFAKRSACDVAGFNGSKPGQLTAAMMELESNIEEHSEAVETGLLAYRAANGIFEFVVADLGIGVLSSLRKCPLYSDLSDHGDALEIALKDGTSRYGSESARGFGFHQLFKSLVELQGTLRFRSGDSALTMRGVSPNLSTSEVSQKAYIRGFSASIACH